MMNSPSRPAERSAATSVREALRITPGSRTWRLLRGVYHLATAPCRTFSDATTSVYRRLTGSGVFLREQELFMCSLCPEQLLALVIERYRPRSVLDVGCGTGQAMKFLADRGIDVWGVEGSALAIERGVMPERVTKVDLRRPVTLGRRFELVWSYEVAEHLPERYAGVFLDTLCRHGEIVVMSAAQPGQAGEGHFNLQPPAYWLSLLAERGYVLDMATTDALRVAEDEFASNMLAVTRGAIGHSGVA